MCEVKLIDIMAQMQAEYNLAMFHLAQAMLESHKPTEEDLCSFLTSIEENPWHNITKHNKQYEWKA